LILVFYPLIRNGFLAPERNPQHLRATVTGL
jgi:hypothetical protein